jgi:hypothetical protein
VTLRRTERLAWRWAIIDSGPSDCTVQQVMIATAAGQVASGERQVSNMDGYLKAQLPDG